MPWLNKMPRGENKVVVDEMVKRDTLASTGRSGTGPTWPGTGGARVAWEDKQQPGRPRRIRQLMNSEDVCPTIEQVLASDAMLDIVAQLMPSPAGIALSTPSC